MTPEQRRQETGKLALILMNAILDHAKSLKAEYAPSREENNAILIAAIAKLVQQGKIQTGVDYPMLLVNACRLVENIK